MTEPVVPPDNPPMPTPELTSAGVPRLSARQFLHELAEELFSLDRGLPWTLWQLLRHPRRSLRGYVIERDARLTRPIRFVLISVAVIALGWQWFGPGDSISDGLRAGLADPQGKATSLQWAMAFFAQHFDLILLLCWIPAIGGALQRVLGEARLNLAEALTVGSYSLGLMLWLQLLVLLLAGEDWHSSGWGLSLHLLVALCAQAAACFACPLEGPRLPLRSLSALLLGMVYLAVLSLGALMLLTLYAHLRG